MINSLKKKYRKFKKECHFFMSVNWRKTIYFNFKKFPFPIAKKLPVYFYGRVKLASIAGEILIDAPIKTAMIGFGQQYEMDTVSNRTAEFSLKGKLVFKGYAQFGKDYFIYVKHNAFCQIGNMASLASRGKLICTKHVVLGDYARLGSESQIIDSNFHQMINTLTNEKAPIASPIVIGNYNYIGNRVSIMSKTKTQNFCTIASNSLCNKDYMSLKENSLIGGIPAKLIKENITRDWKGEQKNLLKNLNVKT